MFSGHPSYRLAAEVRKILEVFGVAHKDRPEISVLADVAGGQPSGH